MNGDQSIDRLVYRQVCPSQFADIEIASSSVPRFVVFQSEMSGTGVVDSVEAGCALRLFMSEGSTFSASRIPRSYSAEQKPYVTHSRALIINH